VLRRTYGKDNRVPHAAKLSQGFKVAPPSGTWQGAGISTGRTKIGVSAPDTRMAKLNLEHGEAMTSSDQEICGVVVVRPASFCLAQEGPEVFYDNHSRRAGNRKLRASASHEIDTATLSTADRPSRSRSIP